MRRHGSAVWQRPCYHLLIYSPMSMKSRQPIAQPYLTVTQAAEYLSVHPSTIRRWIDRGLLPAYRLGEKRIGVRPCDLARLVAPRPPLQGYEEV